MDESSSHLVPENPAPSGSSLTTRLTNVFVAPSEVFNEVKAGRPRPVNWIVPVSIAMITGIIYAMIVFSQPGVFQRMREAQDKKFQELVAEGKMKQAEVEQAHEVTDKFMTPTFFKVIGILGAIFANGAGLFFVALVLWLLGRFVFHGQFEYMQAVEVTGLSTMIAVVGGIISMLLAVIYGDMAMTPSLILLVGHFDPNNKVHLLLTALNAMNIWWLAVLAIGLARLSGAGLAKAAVWVFGLWYGTWSLFVLVLPMLFKGR